MRKRGIKVTHLSCWHVCQIVIKKEIIKLTIKFSKWVERWILNSTSAQSVINKLDKYFSQFGLPAV